jgi:uncharacterized membrane protein SirB2
MEYLVLLHVLSAVVGVGPMFFAPYFLRSRQTIPQLRGSLSTMNAMDYFPKIGGTTAFLSGIALVTFNDYGKFTVLWQLGSLILYLAIQVIVIGFLAPTTKRLSLSVNDVMYDTSTDATGEHRDLLGRARVILSIATLIGLALFVFMVLKPQGL